MSVNDPSIQSQLHFSLDTIVVYRLKNDCQFLMFRNFQFHRLALNRCRHIDQN